MINKEQCNLINTNDIAESNKGKISFLADFSFILYLYNIIYDTLVLKFFEKLENYKVGK